MRENKLRVSFGSLFVVLPIQDRGSFSEAGKHQSVPRGEYFFIAPRLHAALTNRKQCSAATLNDFTETPNLNSNSFSDVFDWSGYVENAVSFKVSFFGNVEILAEKVAVLRSKGVDDFFSRPGEELTFLSFGISILR